MAHPLRRLTAREGMCIGEFQITWLITFVVLIVAVGEVHAYDDECAVKGSHSLDAFKRCRRGDLYSGRRLDPPFNIESRSRNPRFNLAMLEFDIDRRHTQPSQGPRSMRYVDDHDFRRQPDIRGRQLVDQNNSRSQQEARDLLSFKGSLSADPLGTLSSWSANASTPCNWTGVSCSTEGGHVVAVDVHGCQLEGDIGSALRLLSRLQSLEQVDLSENLFAGSLPGRAFANWSGLLYLNISMNYITGALPSQVEGLVNLQTLDLQRNNLTGEIPTSICNCTALKSLDLGTNMLSGSIPLEIGRLSSLELLNLGSFLANSASSDTVSNGNSFSGVIPSSLGNCTSLKSLSLQNNPGLGGELPLSLTHLTNLRVLNLSHCDFTGYIPAWIGNLTGLRTVDLAFNQFRGQIPTSIGNLRELSFLSLVDNNISGTIPPSIVNCTSLIYLRLQYNALLTGEIPSNLGLLSNLRRFTLFYTSVTGVLPASLSNCSNLEYIGVTDNELMDPQPMPAWLGSLANLSMLFLTNIKMNGPIPKEIGRLANLQMLSIYNNSLTGSVPSELGNCTSLWLVQIGGNLLTGNLPSEIGNLPELQKFSVGFSHMSGPLPASLSNLTKLEVFDVSRGNFSGTIDDYWGSLPRLKTALFSLNEFSGSVPAMLGNSTSLQSLDLSVNRLTGEIPPSLGNLTSLAWMSLARNQIRGTVPWELAGLTNLWVLDLGDNRLEGNIPSNIGGLFSLQELSLGTNMLSGVVPESLINCSGMLNLDLADNQLNGTIPANIISRMDSLTVLNLSNNEFSGRWPLQMSNLAHIQVINISGNSLSGAFEFEDGSFLENDPDWKSLQTLDISMNNFTGVIPESLGSLPLLSFFNASFNNFQGPIPDTGVFANLTAVSFLGSPLLCGAILGDNRECQAPFIGSSRSCKGFHCKRVWIPTICSAIFLAGLLILAIWLLVRAAQSERFGGKKLHDFNLAFDPNITFSVDDVLKIIRQNNTIAKGPVNVVYKGMFPGGKTFAVKVLLQNFNESAESGLKNSTSKQSEALHEVGIMTNLRHRNILKVVGYCSHKETKALVLEYMPEGSLSQHLHGSGEGKCRLSWQRRLDIALGVAEGMMYLHHDFPAPLIHGDLKPSNILLDHTFVPKVADFGLSKFVSPHRELQGQASAFALCGTIGYIPPEYALAPIVSTKGDVYSYGIVLLELLSGKSPTSASSANFDPSIDYRKWAVANYYEDPVSLVDSALRNESSTDYKVREQTRLMLLVALLCTREMPQSRPTMRDVLSMLIDINKINLNPIERKSIETLIYETQDQTHSYFNPWSLEDPNGKQSPS